MNKERLTFTLIGGLIVGAFLVAKSLTPVYPPPNLNISYECVTFSNIFLQIEPYYTNSAWFTNEYDTNLIISGSTLNTAFIGPCIRLSWSNNPNMVLQSSTNFYDWEDLRVKFLGPEGVWYTHPIVDKRFYRLRSAE